MEIAVNATTIPLSIFTNLFHQRFSKHDYLESTLEILQQFYQDAFGSQTLFYNSWRSLQVYLEMCSL
jgi:hypothetical protein